MTLCKATIEYDGAAYHGWQIQVNAGSVQAELEKALFRLTGSPVRVKGAGRTDAGVHARGQTACFPLPENIPLANLARAINSRLPADIAVVAIGAVDDAFDPRRDCVMKQYSYSFVTGDPRPALGNRRAWHIKRRLDRSAMRAAATCFVGTHDFTSFCNQELAGRDNVRTVDRSELLVLPDDHAGRGRMAFIAEGRSFLYNMVRALAGTLIDVGCGRFRPEDIPNIIAARRRDAAGQGAPPWGLCLEWTLYPGDERPAERFVPARRA